MEQSRRWHNPCYQSIQYNHEWGYEKPTLPRNLVINETTDENDTEQHTYSIPT